MRRFSRAPWIMATLLLFACSKTEKPEGGAAGAVDPKASRAAGDVEGIYQKSWAGFVAQQPDAMKQLLEQNPNQGWVKLYNRDYPGAQAAFASGTSPAEKLGLARSHLADAELFLAAYRFSLEVEDRYLKLWEENASRLQKTAFYDFMAGLAALRRGTPAEAIPRLQAFRKSAEGKDSSTGAVAAVLEGEALRATGDAAGAEKAWKDPIIARHPGAAAMLAGVRLEQAPEGGKAPELAEPSEAYGRRNLFWAQVQAGNLEGARATLGAIDHKAPDHEETVNLPEGPVTRRYYDPLVLRSMARLHAKLALQALGSEPGAAFYKALAEQALEKKPAAVAGLPAQVDAPGLPAFLFSAYPTPADMNRAAARLAGGAVGPEGLLGQYLAAVGPIPETSGDGRDTRQAVEVAEAMQAAARKVISASANEEGKNTVIGLKVPQGDTGLAVRERAEAYREKGRLLEALFLLEHTLDKDDVKVSYINDPLLFLEISRIYCSLGRYREALNYFYRLVEARPELWLIQESLGNLSVLGTVDQAGRTAQQD